MRVWPLARPLPLRETPVDPERLHIEEHRDVREFVGWAKPRLRLLLVLTPLSSAAADPVREWLTAFLEAL